MKRNNSKGFAHLELLLVIVILAIIGFIGWYVVKARGNANQSLSNATSSSQALPTQTKQSTTLPAQSSSGSDDTSLNSDLNSINASQSQEDKDSSSSSNAINDQQHQVSVPTN